MKKILLIALLLSGCAEGGEDILIGVGDKIPIENADVVFTDQFNLNYHALPIMRGNTVYLGGGWVYFELFNECFIKSLHGQASVMGRIKCKEGI